MTTIARPRTIIKPDKLSQYLLPADIGFERGPTLVSKLIRILTRRPSESPTYTNHTFGIGTTGNVVEALARVTTTPILEWYLKLPKHTEFEIWRYRFGGLNLRSDIAHTAESYIGSVYGGLKIVAHLGDCLLTRIADRDIYFFRRLCRLKRYPICNWLWGWAFSAHDIRLSIPGPRTSSPDDQHDYVSSHPEKFILIAKRYPNGSLEVFG